MEVFLQQYLHRRLSTPHGQWILSSPGKACLRMGLSNKLPSCLLWPMDVRYRMLPFLIHFDSEHLSHSPRIRLSFGYKRDSETLPYWLSHAAGRNLALFSRIALRLVWRWYSQAARLMIKFSDIFVFLCFFL